MWFERARNRRDKLTREKKQEGPGPVLQPARELMVRRDYRAALDLLDATPTPSPDVTRLILRCHLALQDLEATRRVFDALTPSTQALLPLRALALEAAAVQGDRVRLARLVAMVLDLPDWRAAAWLASAWRFAPLMDAAMRDRVLDRVLAQAPDIAGAVFGHLILCGHSLAAMARWDDLASLSATLAKAATPGLPSRQLRLLQAQAAFRQGRHADHLAALNALLAEDGSAPLHLMDGAGETLTLDRLVCDCPAATRRGPAVSVIMPAFNTAATIGYALRSLQAQTYRDLEIIVVDDGGTDDTASIVAGLGERDPRIRLIRQPRNMGTYVARNAGLAAAGGFYTTVQDADDWAHPQKIERLVDALANAPDRTGAVVQHIRWCPERGLRGIGGYLRPDASSLLFRRQQVLARIGYYDSVRAGGDTEFHLRLQRAFGPDAILALPHLLSFVHWSDQTLSGERGALGIDPETGILGPARRAYWRAFIEWQAATGDLKVPFPASVRPFPAPAVMLP